MKIMHHFVFRNRLNLVFLISFFAILSWKNNVNAQSLRTFTSYAENFSIGLPSSWEKKEKYMGTTVIALSPVENSSDTFRENVSVVTEKLPVSMSNEKYLELSLQNIRKMLTDFNMISQGNAVLSGKQGKWIKYTHRMGQIKILTLQFFALTSDRAYVITCTTAPNTFDQYKGQFRKIIESFQIGVGH